MVAEFQQKIAKRSSEGYLWRGLVSFLQNFDLRQENLYLFHICGMMVKVVGV